MAIKILERIEPLSDASFREREAPPMASSRALNGLRDALCAYVKGTINGASYLIAGHRGSGKTTLVHRAVEEVLRETDPARFRNLRPARDPDNAVFAARPMLVRLNGPNLLTTGATTGNTLKEIGKSLFVSFAEEITSAFRRKAVRDRERHPGRAAECREIAAALKIDLYSLPTEAWLREVWDRVGCFDGGILFDSEPAPEDQGLRELVALSSALQVFAVTAFNITSQLDKVQGTSSETKSTAALAAQGEGLRTALTALLALGTAGGTAIAAQKSVGSALVAGIVGLATLAGFSWTSTRTRTRHSSYKVTYLPNMDESSLARMLPDLVGRVLEAGLAPVFVIDELDKIDHLETRMKDLVKNMKQFVTERAFFCFLVGRGYFESFSDTRNRKSYRPEYTFFSNRLFISYSTDDLHAYLDRVLKVS